MVKPDSTILIVGARSDIGMALAHAYGARGCALVLAARNAATLSDAKADLEIRHRVPVALVECDVTLPDPQRVFQQLDQAPDTVILVAGLLGDNESAVARTEVADEIMVTNYNGPVRIILEAARHMEARGSGTIIGISSVAGDRGRGSNLVYGSAKAGLTAFLSGLRNRLARKGVHVLTVKPGFVATRMTAGINLPPRLTAQPKAVAEAILRGHERQKDIVYVKSVWRPIMAVIRAIPEPLFKRLSL